jgi:predicted O-linked N-acetylglucosamine transferase (SPINDLY family)
MNIDLEIRAVELANVLASQGRTAEAIVAYQAAVAARPAELTWRCNLAALLSESGRHEEAIREADAALAFQHACARSAASALPAQVPLWRGEIYQHTRIRVAYLSSDFYAHATAYLAAGLFEHHDRNRFECFGLAYGKAAPNDPMRARLQAAFEHFEDAA